MIYFYICMYRLNTNEAKQGETRRNTLNLSVDGNIRLNFLARIS